MSRVSLSRQGVYPMNKLLLSTAIFLAFAAPAAAANTALIMWNGANPGGAETATGTDSADLTASSLNGITITLSFVSRQVAPDDLTTGQINIDNTTGSVQTLHIIAGANAYPDNVSGFDLTATVGVTLGSADFSGDYFVDGTNSLNGQTETVTGTSIDTFNSGVLSGPKSFSFNGSVTDHVMGPFGLAEELTISLQPGAEIFVQGASMTAVPEIPTWAMFVAGMAVFAPLVTKRAKSQRFTDA